MTTIRVSALDTAQAMEEIAAKLGADAMIIDTFKRDGKIEMIATGARCLGERRGKIETAAWAAMPTARTCAPIFPQ